MTASMSAGLIRALSIASRAALTDKSIKEVVAPARFLVMMPVL
jgi:hypothetical protein